MFLAIMIIAFIACENPSWNCLRGNGIIETETRDLQYYNGVVSEGAFEVFYIMDTIYSVELKTDENLIPYIRTRVSGNTLIVDNGTRKCLRSEYPIQIFVHAPEISLMSLAGSGMISADYIYTDALILQIEGSGVIDMKDLDVIDLEALVTGSGDVDLWGRAKNAIYTITGSGTISAQNLRAHNCIAEISGSGTIYCYSEEKIHAIISGSGSIFYLGNPSEVNTNVTGSGVVKTIP